MSECFNFQSNNGKAGWNVARGNDGDVGSPLDESEWVRLGRVESGKQVSRDCIRA